MDAEHNTVLELAKTFNLAAFWEINLSQNEPRQGKEIEFSNIERPIYDPESQAGQIWKNGRMQNFLQMNVRTITKEKAAALKIEVAREFEEMRETALGKTIVINNPAPILSKEVAKVLESIEPAKLEGLASGFMPDFAIYPENTVKTLAKVMFVQWVYEILETKEECQPSSDNDNTEKWKTDYIIYALHRLGVFDLPGFDKLTTLGKYKLISNLTGKGVTNVRLSMNALAHKTARHNPKRYIVDFEEWLREHKNKP